MMYNRERREMHELAVRWGTFLAVTLPIMAALLWLASCAPSPAQSWSDAPFVDDPYHYGPPSGGVSGEVDPVFSAWQAAPVLESLRLGGTTNVLTDDGTNLLRNGVMIAGSGAGTIQEITGDPRIMVGGATGPVVSLTFDADNIARDFINLSELISLHGISGVTEVRPGQLVLRDIAPTASRHVYIATNVLNFSEYATNDTTWVPLGADDRYWKLFVQRGADGSTGPRGVKGDDGVDGLDGVGNIQYGVWDSSKVYTYDTNTPIVVSYAGRWYDLIASSTNNAPTSVAGPNYWSISIDKGADGTIVGWTNLTFRGTWNSGDEYVTDNAVWRSGNLFVVDATNVPPPIGTAPSTDGNGVGQSSAHWTIAVQRGMRGATGATGARGDDGDVINSYDVYALFGTNSTFNNAPTATNRMMRWVSSTGDNHVYSYTGEAWLGTNRLSATAGALFLNGIEYESGGGVTNLGTGLTGTGLETPLEVAGYVTISNAAITAFNWGDHADEGYLTSYTETDPLWASWLGSTFTNAVDARIGTVGVTGAVTSINGLDGDVTLAPGDNVTITTNDNTLTIAASGGGATGAVESESAIITFEGGPDTVITLLGSTNNWQQVLTGITNSFQVQMPLKSSTNEAAQIMLTIENTGGHAASWVTNQPPIAGFVPTIPTNAVSEFLLWSPARDAEWYNLGLR